VNGLSSTDIFLSLGRRGSGKSYLLRRISAAYPRKVIFDSLGEYTDTDGSLCYSFEEFTQAVLNTEHDSSFTIIFRFDPEKEDSRPEFNEALRILWYRGNCFVLIEEIQLFASTHAMPLWLKNALLTGRHRNLALGFSTQRPGECHKTIISQANHVFAGSLHEKNDLDYVRSVVGEGAYQCPLLQPRQFIYFRPGQEITKINNDLALI